MTTKVMTEIQNLNCTYITVYKTVFTITLIV